MEEILFRIIVVGDSCVGKSSIVLRFTEESFMADYRVTVGVEFGTRTIEMNNKLVKLQIWDTAGQENYRSLTRSFYRNADGVIVVYDMTSKETFDHCVHWLKEIRMNSCVDVVVYLMGNQSDLIEEEEDKRKVLYEEGLEFSNKNSLNGFAEVSAKTGKGINEGFKEFSNILLARWKDKNHVQVSELPKIELKPEVVKKKRKFRC